MTRNKLPSPCEHAIRFETLMHIVWDGGVVHDIEPEWLNFFALGNGQHTHVSSNAIKVARMIGLTPIMDWDAGHLIVTFPDGSSCVITVCGGSIEVR